VLFCNPTLLSIFMPYMFTLMAMYYLSTGDGYFGFRDILHVLHLILGMFCLNCVSITFMIKVAFEEKKIKN